MKYLQVIQRNVITADKILISIHRTAIIILVIKIIRIAGAILSKQNCFRYRFDYLIGGEMKRLRGTMDNDLSDDTRFINDLGASHFSTNICFYCATLFLC